MGAPKLIVNLVNTFERYKGTYQATTYKETETRRKFIDPFFTALGWDVDNHQGLGPALEEVIHEYTLPGTGKKLMPDYRFTIGGETKFFVEAKKPSANLKEGRDAIQLRRYGYSANLGISILTDFEEFALYDCRVEPTLEDDAATRRLKFFSWKEYLERWDELQSLLSRDSVAAGSLDEFDVKTRDTVSVDERFLRDIESWRLGLAADLARNNSTLTERELNYSVQQIIDRIIFLRFCEDRSIEDADQLYDVAKPDEQGGEDGFVYRELCRLFLKADYKYNSGLFHFRKEPNREQPDGLTLKLNVGNEVLKKIVGRLYFPNPYQFSVFPAEILGQVYEQFLGQVIRLDDEKGALVEEKPEVRRAGGVYYTPSHIVRYIVRSTLEPLLQGRKPAHFHGKNPKTMRVVDPACGSGSFLIEAYQFLLDWYLDAYLTEGPEKWGAGRNQRLYKGLDDKWFLTASERKRILTDHIFGVDIDSQAVEVTKLSLLLKVLEGETRETLLQQLQLVQERALPDLGDNIKCGNSLISSNYAQGQLLADSDAMYSINAFNWQNAFPTVFSAGGFEAVTGNPPWLMAGYYTKDSLDYLRAEYSSASDRFDLYYVFLEKAIQLVRETGRVSMIVPNKHFHTRSASDLRLTLAAGSWLESVIDFGSGQVFKGATNYSCILFLRKGSTEDVLYSRATPSLELTGTFNVPRETLAGENWYFHDQETRRLFKQMNDVGEPLEKLALRFGTGVQSGADTVLAFNAGEAEALGLEMELLRPVLRGRDVRRFWVTADPKLLVFPYHSQGDEFEILSDKELARFPNIKALLTKHKDRLANRVWFGKNAEQLSGKWYGMVYLDKREFFNRPHLLTPSLSNRSNFAVGTGHLFATGTAGVTSLVLKEHVAEDLLYLLGVLNSQLLSFYAISHSPIFSGGYFKFSAPYLKHLPIARLNLDRAAERDRHDAIVSHVKEAIKVRNRLESARTTHDREVLSRSLAEVERSIDEVVYDLYGVDRHTRDFAKRAELIISERTGGATFA